MSTQVDANKTPKSKYNEALHTEISTAIVLGETGAGKSTLLNTFANCLVPTSNLKQPTIIIPTKHYPTPNYTKCVSSSSPAHTESSIDDVSQSNTIGCTTYEFELMIDIHGKMHPPETPNILCDHLHTIRLIDTPGLNDTRGVEQDHINLNMITEVVESAINLCSIIIVINGTSARITPAVKTLFHRFSSALPDSVLNNVIIVFTNCDPMTRNFNIRDLCSYFERGYIFHFNNLLFGQNPHENWSQAQTTRLQSNWNSSMSSSQLLLQTVIDSTTIAVDGVGLMRELRNAIRGYLHECQIDMQNLQRTLDEIIAAKQRHMKSMDDIQLLTTERVVEQIKWEKVTYCNQICRTCDEVCIENEECMDDELEYCMICEKRNMECHYTTHYTGMKIKKIVQETIREIVENAAEKYEIALQERENAQKQLDQADLDLETLQAAMDRVLLQVSKACIELKTHCRSFDLAKEIAVNIYALELMATKIVDVRLRQQSDRNIKALEEIANRIHLDSKANIEHITIGQIENFIFIHPDDYQHDDTTNNEQNDIKLGLISAKQQQSKQKDEVRTIMSSTLNHISMNPINDLHEKLVFAVQHGDVAGAEELIKQGAEYKFVDSKGLNLLHNACEYQGYDSIEMIDFIIGLGIDLESRTNPNLNTPIIIAVSFGNINMARRLLQLGANIRACNKAGQSLLHKATQSNKPEIIDFVFSLGIFDVDIRDTLQHTPLMFAASLGKVISCQTLVAKYNANIHAVNKDGQNMSHFAIASRYKPMIEYCNTLYGVNSSNTIPTTPKSPNSSFSMQSPSKSTTQLVPPTDQQELSLDDLLVQATRNGDLNLCKSLIAKKANPQYIDPKGLNLLHNLCEGHSRIDILEYLLDLGLDIDSRTSPNLNTPLMISSAFGHNLNFIKRLIERGASVSVTNRFGHTLLHKAVQSNNQTIIDFFVEQIGIQSIHTRDANGFTPFMFAVILGLNTSADILYTKYKSNTQLLTIQNRTIAELAQESRNEAMIIFVGKISLGDKLAEACRQGNVPVAKQLIMQRADPHHITEKGLNLLHCAAEGTDSIEMMEYLLQLGLSIESQTIPNLNTPVMIAAAFGRLGIVKLLLNRGATLKVLNKFQQTLLHRCVQSNSIEIVDYVMSLKGGNFDVNHADINGLTPLMLAVALGKLQVAQHLVKKYKAKPKLVDNNGKTLFHFAVESDNVAMVLWVDKAGAKLKVADNLGRKPLEYATILNKTNAAEALLTLGAK